MTAVAAAPRSLDATDNELAAIAKALGHPVRVRILRLLMDRSSCYCGEIVEELPLAQATVSQHLKVLKDAGLIVGTIDGPRVCYCAHRDRLERFGGLVHDLVAFAQSPNAACCNEQ
jgi:ArsR family transcriptional regulator